MKIKNVPFSVVDWHTVEQTEFKRETNNAYWKIFQNGNIQVHMVEYSPGYLTDYCCNRGRVILVLEGVMINELKHGTRNKLTAGMSYQVKDDELNPHRTCLENESNCFSWINPSFFCEKTSAHTENE
jgi:hypothetical protein